MHCCNHSNVVGRAGTGRHHACHCTPYGSPSTAPSSPHRGAPVNHYAFTLEAAPAQVQGTPRRRDQNKARQDRRHLHRTVHHTSPRSQIVRHTCKSSSPWSIKGRRSPRRGRDGRQDMTHTRLAPHPLYDIGTCLNHSFGTWRPRLLSHSACSRPLQAPRCKAI
jgi:hypothetical protein